MTVSDDPSEGATDLDDDALLEACLDGGTDRTSGSEAGPDMSDWPPVWVRNVDLQIDTATLVWFRSRHTDWRREIGTVLRAWVIAQSNATSNESVPD